MQKNNVWLIGFPKSGNTWASYLLSYILNLKFVDYDDRQKIPSQKWIKNFTSGNNSWKAIDKYHCLFKSHKILDFNSKIKNENKVFYIQRDPRDVYLSFKNFMNNSFAGWKGRLRFHLLGLLGEKVRIKWFLSRWSKHVEYYKRQNIIHISYEELHKGGAKYLYNKINYEAGLDVGFNLIEQAFEEFTFKKMSKGRNKGSEDKSSFYRKGVVGGWSKSISEKNLKLFEKYL